MIISLDTETAPILPGLAAPPLVCVSFASTDTDGNYATDVKDHVDGLTEVAELLADPHVTIVGHRIAFDLTVMCAEAHAQAANGTRNPAFGDFFTALVFSALAAGRIRCTQIRETLIAIATGTMPRDDKARKGMFTLEAVAKKRCGMELRKTLTKAQAKANPELAREVAEIEAIRTGYGKLRGVPIAEWPKAAVDYVLKDASTPLAVYYAQAEAADDYCEDGQADHAVKTEPHEVRAAFALELQRAWGLRTDKPAIDKLETELRKQFAEVDGVVRAAGVVRENGTENMKALRALVIEAYTAIGREPPMTEPNRKTGKGGGNIATDADTLRDSGHPVLVARADRKGLEKLLNTFIPALRIGETVPLNAGWNVLVTTTRTSCSKPNLQQPPKAGGVRECIIARPGFVFCSVDYDTIELKALSYFCESTFGYSAMADAIRSGIDVHTKFAARLLGIDYEEAKANKKRPDVKQARDTAKAYNFGLPGGMGDPRFQDHAHGDGLDFSLEQIAHFRSLWFEEWPEMRDFFAYVGRLVGKGGTKAAITAPGLGVVLGDRGYCDACNAHFQVPVAVGAKRALFDVSRECYTMPDSPLYGSRPVLFIHDEIILEIPEHKAHEAAKRQAEVMIAAMQPLFPTVPITASPALMRRWSKAADAAYDANGRLIPYEDAALKAAA